jgi:glycosyltransferase involved in cell wall biosynthesis
VDPTDPTAFADALLSATTDEPVRERLGAAGVERAVGFSWQRTADLTDALLGELLSGIT